MEDQTGRGVTVLLAAPEKHIRPVRQAAIRSDKPWRSQAAGICKQDYAKETQKLKDAGILGPARYEPGRHGGYDLVCDSRSVRNAALRVRERFDADGGYGDYTGG